MTNYQLIIFSKESSLDEFLVGFEGNCKKRSSQDKTWHYVVIPVVIDGENEQYVSMIRGNDAQDKVECFLFNDLEAVAFYLSMRETFSNN